MASKPIGSNGKEIDLVDPRMSRISARWSEQHTSKAALEFSIKSKDGLRGSSRHASRKDRVTMHLPRRCSAVSVIAHQSRYKNDQSEKTKHRKTENAVEKPLSCLWEKALNARCRSSNSSSAGQPGAGRHAGGAARSWQKFQALFLQQQIQW